MVVQYDGYGWLGCTMAVDAEDGSVTGKFYHPHYHYHHFHFLNPLICNSDIVSQVNPVTATGRTHTLTMAEAATIIAQGLE